MRLTVDFGFRFRQANRTEEGIYNGTIAKNTWKWGRPVWSHLLCHWSRDRRDLFYVLPNVNVFHLVTLAQDIQTTNVTHQYVSFLSKEVAECFDGALVILKVQCLHQGILTFHDTDVVIQQYTTKQKSVFFDCLGR